jgi:hypothetical protein
MTCAASFVKCERALMPHSDRMVQAYTHFLSCEHRYERPGFGQPRWPDIPLGVSDFDYAYCTIFRRLNPYKMDDKPVADLYRYGPERSFRRTAILDVSKHWVVKLTWSPWVLQTEHKAVATLALGLSDGSVQALRVVRECNPAAGGLLDISLRKEVPSQIDSEKRSITALHWVDVRHLRASSSSGVPADRRDPLTVTGYTGGRSCWREHAVGTRAVAT